MDTSNIVKNIAFGNYEAAKEAINHILLTKTAMALDEKKKEVAKKMYCEECNESGEKIEEGIGTVVVAAGKAVKKMSPKDLSSKQKINKLSSKSASGSAGPTGMTAMETEE